MRRRFGRKYAGVDCEEAPQIDVMSKIKNADSFESASMMRFGAQTMASA